MNQFLIFAAEKEAENGIFFPSDINEFYWGVAAFLVVVVFLVWRVLPGVKKMLRGNSEKLEQELTTAQTSKQESQERTKELLAQLGDISTKREEMLSEARQAAVRLEEDLIARAEAESEEMRRRGEAEVEMIRSQATSDLQTEVGVWVSAAAEALIAENLAQDQTAQAALVDAYISRDLAEKVS